MRKAGELFAFDHRAFITAGMEGVPIARKLTALRIELRPTALAVERVDLFFIRAGVVVDHHVGDRAHTVFVNRGDSGFNDPLPADLLALASTATQAPVKLEMELAAMGDEDRQTFMADMGVAAFRRNETILAMFYGVGRNVFFTVGEDECRTWSIPKGCEAVEAAGCIHKDLSEKFVRANVIGFDDFVACGYSEKEAKTRGLNRTEGKTYIVKDADIMHILASS